MGSAGEERPFRCKTKQDELSYIMYAANHPILVQLMAYGLFALKAANYREYKTQLIFFIFVTFHQALTIALVNPNHFTTFT